MSVNVKALAKVADRATEIRQLDLYETITSSIPERVADAVAYGWRSLNIMEVPDTEYHKKFFGLGYRLSGVAKMVFNYCKTLQLRPKVVTYGNGGGFHRIVVRW